ncbi:MAG TPA: M1 family aminopeptidase [Candidatus Limnocylindria bacterium]|nr:M1 family aminopeptidase [Candidatus Limnocylindria bacterium]
MARPAAPSRFRLPPDVRPSTYDLHLAPDLASRTFRGSVRVGVRVGAPAREIVLHAAELTIERARILLAHAVLDVTVEPRPRDETIVLRAMQPIPAGEAVCEIAFSGRMNPHLRGFYGVESDGRAYAFTQCEAADARRIFPCFDEPAMKARFRLSVTVRDGDVALSNAPVAREERTGGSERVVYFAETPPLSTYLFALAVGPLEATPPRRVGRTPVRVWHVPGKSHLAAFGVEAGAESLVRLEHYFGLPYPYAKLDLVAVPDFEAGAMENAGAVFFRETLLLLDPATVSIQERKRAAEVIAHELAHMWYGNLVTMAWWDDLWLNEAFATWMAYRVVHAWQPTWRMWESFEHDRASALALDALVSTHPIYAPVHSVAEATENFDVITYEKGAAVVRMIEHYLGPAVFQRGVRRYMRRHREGNAVAADLWRALAEESGQDVARVAQAWIAQPGFPLLTLRRAPGGRRLRVRQERFFSDPRRRAAGRPLRWPVPLVVKTPTGIVRALVTRASAEVPLGRTRPSWVYGNAAAGGFYRVAHDPADLAALLAHPAATLTAVERLALVGDQWALVRSGRASIESFLAVVDALGEEHDHDVLDGLAAALAVLDEQVTVPGSPLQKALRRWIAGRFGPAFRKLGWKAGPRETDAVRLRRAALLRIVGGIAEDAETMRTARTWLDRYLRNRRALEPNLADAVVGLAARGGDLALYERYRAVIDRARTPQERRRFLLQLASFRAPAAVRRTLRDALTPAIPTQDVAFVFMRMFANPAAGEPAWRFLTSHWKAVRERIPPLMLARLVDATPALRELRFAREVGAFFRANPLPEAARALRQALEVFRLNAELRRRVTPGLRRWLADRTPS